MHDPSSSPVRCTRKTVRVFPGQKCCADSLSVCPTPVCVHTHTNDHVRTLKIPYRSPCQSSVDYGSLRRPSMHLKYIYNDNNGQTFDRWSSTEEEEVMKGDPFLTKGIFKESNLCLKLTDLKSSSH